MKSALGPAVLLLLLTTGASAATTRELLPLPGTAAGPLAPPADPNHFTFAVGGDNRSTGRGVPAPPTAREIFTELRLLQPAFCLWTGDAIYGSDDTVGEARGEYASFLADAAIAATPLFNAPGNHEIYDRPDLASLYEQAMGRLYGSFDYGNSHLIALDTEEVGQKVGIGAAQLEWLRQDLAANRGANIFVFTHHPLFAAKPTDGFTDPAARDALHRLFVEAGVKMVISGHEHLFYQSVHDGVHYVVTGGGGAPSETTPMNGAFQHYILVTVNDHEVAITVLEPWRLFATFGPVQPDGSCLGRIDNYSSTSLSAVLEFPTDALGSKAAATATLTYKGTTHVLSAEIVPPHTPGTTAVRVTAAENRSVLVSLHAARPPAPAAP